MPLYDPDFGDAAQVFETFTYMGYLASTTKGSLIGTAAAELPLSNPWLVRKAAATVQTLSDQRYLLGIASADRHSEYRVFGVDFLSRVEGFRQAVSVLL